MVQSSTGKKKRRISGTPFVLEQVTSQTQESLDACVETGLLLSERDQLTSHHELWREAVLDAVPAHRQVALHRVVLAALVNADVRDDLLARLAITPRQLAPAPPFSSMASRRRNMPRSSALTAKPPPSMPACCAGRINWTRATFSSAHHCSAQRVARSGRCMVSRKANS